MKILVILLVVTLANSLLAEDIEQKWADFKKTFEKIYAEAEETYRKENFIKNLAKINNHNRDYRAGLVSYYLGTNHLTDMLFDEFASNYLTGIKHTTKINPSKNANKKPVVPGEMEIQIPESVDWRKHGAVTEVKNQKNCRSCWSFSAAGAIEAQLFLKTKKLVSLSEQNLVDCTSEYGNYGCGGGWPEHAFEYVIHNKGIDTEESYPYEDATHDCRYKASNSATTISGYNNLESGDEEQLKRHVALVGPVSTVIDATGYQFYAGGVYDYKPCQTEKGTGNHAVLIVGYNTTHKGEDYWLVKNSWGPYWGLDGYVLMSRNKNNQCGIAAECSYPIL